MTARLTSGIGLALLLAVAAPAAAQAPSLRATPAAYQSTAGLRLAASPAAEADVGERSLNMMVSRGRRHSGTVLMIVGAAGIVTGLIVDEPIVTVAGAVVGGIGLYMYLDSGGKVGIGAN